ncbi:sensor histidine kinase [Novosphingobium guangzhouense]|uniref:histidine kinase n=1 Tax=Novosphingobium guangzhouense TaxID=1850347 RepID=A0A2K2G3K0_9SPHN|nr:ATP-binding protein [Novosphingobium guangzhouense]PNU05591.1 hypothetical protein A8V01_15635 [Novosphingobium guangzhouense]
MLKRWRFGGLRQRIGVIVMIHALLMLGSVTFVVRGLASNGDRIWMVPDATRIAAIVTVFERAAPETYPDLIHALHDDRTNVRLLPGLPQTVLQEQFPEGHSRDVASAYRNALAGRPFRVEARGQDISEALDDQPRYSSSPIRVFVALPNGHALEIERTTPAPVGRFLSNIASFAAIVLLLDLLVISWLAAQTTRPMDRLVHAVRRDDPKAMLLRGPREFAELGRAFHDLRGRLHGMMEERTRIIAAVAHDFRTYLTRLELRSDFIDDPEQRALASEDLREMRELMNDALTFARPDAAESTADSVIDLTTELERAVALQRDAGTRVTLVAGEPVQIAAGGIAFQRMMANLLDNAARYGGARDGGSGAQVRWVRADGHVLVIVEDDGPGVPAARLNDILEPFSRLEESRARHTGGVGLGLSIVQALAHRAGGDLRLENRAEGGLRAVLELPLHRKAS